MLSSFLWTGTTFGFFHVFGNLNRCFISLWKFAKFLISFLKVQISFLSNFVSIVSATKHNSSAQFSTNIMHFSQGPIKVQIFKASKCSGQNLSNSSCQLWIDKSVPLRFLHHSSLLWHNSCVSFSLINFLLWIKGSHQSHNLRLSSALVKICQILPFIFQTTSQFFYKFCITLQCHER